MSALLICDRATHDADSGQVSLIGIREEIVALGFPMTISSLHVYAKMTDARGEYVFRLELVRAGYYDVRLSANDTMFLGSIGSLARQASP